MTAKLSKETAFFIYLLNHYAQAKNKSADKILAQWEQLNLTQFIFDLYEIYHSERLENAFEDIDKLILARQQELSA